MGPGDTHDLLQQLLAGDEEARGRLLERLRPMLVLWCSTRMSARLKANFEPEDMAQEILTRVHKGIGGFDGSDGKAFYGWLFTVAKNCVRDHADYVGAEKRRLPPPSSLTQTSPSLAARRREDVARLMAALDRLEEADRDVITLVKIEELPQEAVAELQGRSVNAVRIHLCRALKRLQAELAGGGGSAASDAAETSGRPVR